MPLGITGAPVKYFEFKQGLGGPLNIKFPLEIEKFQEGKKVKIVLSPFNFELSEVKSYNVPNMDTAC